MPRAMRAWARAKLSFMPCGRRWTIRCDQMSIGTADAQRFRAFASHPCFFVIRPPSLVKRISGMKPQRAIRRDKRPEFKVFTDSEILPLAACRLGDGGPDER